MTSDINTGEILLNKKNQSYILTLIIIFVLIAALVFFYLFSFVPIEGESMENTIHDKQYCFSQRKFYDVNRGDIVIIGLANGNDSHDIVKRVIGISGDKIIFMRGENNHEIDIYLCKNDENSFKKINEPYLKEKMQYVPTIFHDTPVMQYNPKLTEYNLDTLDSDTYDKVIKDTIMVPNGRIFFLGDNRNVSRDSRYYGTQPLEKVKYKVLSVIY